MRTGYLFLGCLCMSVAAFAQRKDSVMLSAVTVYGVQDAKYLAGSSVQSLDSGLQASERSRHLGEILSLQLPIYFRNYGNGMLSGISMRGTSPQHTAVLWNGINITSFSLGQADFSILPAVAFDEVRVHEGAGSARFGSGAFGGTVLLNSKSSTGNTLTFSQDVGSFGRYFSSLSGQASVKRWGLKTRWYDLNSTNDFKILATDERQRHAQFRQTGFIQDVEYKISATKILTAHYWYHNADRNLQYSIGQASGNDTQQDRNHRLSIRFQNHSQYGLLSLSGGYVKDAIVYDGSNGTVVRFISGIRNEFTLASTFHVLAGAEWNHIIGEIPDYKGGKAKEDRFDFTTSVQRNFGNRLSIAVNLRQPVVSGFNAPFLPYIGADYVLIATQKNQLKLRGSISKNYRIPTLNDRYWVYPGNIEGGNKSLLPETTRAAETGLVWKMGDLEISSTWFAQKVNNWIQWINTGNGIFRPHNIEQVLAEGTEVKINFRKQLGSWSLTPQASWQYTRSITTQAPPDQLYALDKQLIYTPKNTASGYLQVGHKMYSGNISAQYSGIRFTDTGNSNSYALPAYAVMNVTFGRYWKLDDHRVDLQISVKNILNTNYQLYSGYALPGRNYNIQLTCQLISNQPSK